MSWGFVDLRADRPPSGTSSESFWPSFTDIMMVVVMIFLISSTVLIVRNWELMADLRESIASERAAAERARSLSETSATLEERLAQAEHELSLMRMQLMQANEIDQERTRQLAEREQQLRDARALAEQFDQQAQSAQREIEALNERLAEEAARVAAQSARLQTATEQLSALETRLREQSAELASVRQESSDKAQALAALEGEYGDLKIKYDELIKPARTAEGKHVVEVRYEKRAGRARISLKEPAGSAFDVVNRETMDRRLAALRRKHGSDLYVKVIIPENSGLSYSEAWSFTKHVLQSYDYYYQN
jgi:chromosome segregation ATPase